MAYNRLFRPFLFFVIGLISIASTASAQPSRTKSLPGPGDKQSPVKPPRDDEAVRLNEARVAFAIQIVSALADEARSYKDESLRSRVQARVADALWGVDPERARVLFNRSWEAAETADEEGRRRNEEERKRFLSGQGTGFIPPRPNLRSEVLRLASLHDRTLAEGFLAKMEEKNKQSEGDNSSTRNWDPTEPPEATAKRLQLARQLLENGDTEKALLFAEPALNRVTSQGIIFLVLLRQKNSALADQLYSSLLERTGSDPIADATSVSILSSYVFTPSVLVTSTRNGVFMNPWTAMLPPPQLSAALRAKFFGIASQVLLRPLGPQELELTSAGVGGTYFTIRRLLPLFEQSSPEMAEALQGRLNMLVGGDEIIPPQQRELMKAGFETKEKQEREPDDTIARIERASSSTERDHLYAMAARNAVATGNPKAGEFADKIEDANLKKAVRNFVDFVTISKTLEKRDAEKALRLIRAAELTHFQSAWSYTEIAVLLLPASPPERVAGLINEAMTEAGRIEVSNVESAEAWVAIAAGAGTVDPSRKWETVIDAARAINRAADYSGEESGVSVGFQTRKGVAKISVAAPSINLAALFERLAQADVYRAADMAMSIKNESPRAIALLAVGRSVFDSRAKKSKP